jgi:IclR family KDG regulon transcriptional repressor
LDHLDIYSAARPVAEDLSEALGETAHVGVLDGDSAIYILKVESRHTIRMFSRVGRRIPLYCTAIGKVLLAFLPESVRESALREVELVACTSNTHTTRATLGAELERIRRQGFALDAEEHEEGIHCIGAPIFDRTGTVVATLSVSWPDFRYRSEEEAEYVDHVKTAAARVSWILGHAR